MHKKLIIIILVITFAVIGFVAWSYSNSDNGPAPVEAGKSSSLATSEMFYDFGTISMAKGKVSHVFRITNPTDKDITIGNLSTSCMCTTAYIIKGDSKLGPFGMAGMGFMPKANELVSAQGMKDIEVVFDPAAHGPSGVGDIDRLINVTETNGASLQLEIKAVVTP